LNEEDASEPIRLRLDIEDRALAERLAALLAGIPGVALAGPGEPADLEVRSPASSGQTEGEAALTARELEVLALLAEGASNKAIARRLPCRLASR
jgi:DNA-binding NarL/FixJ family response regulator